MAEPDNTLTSTYARLAKESAKAAETTSDAISAAYAKSAAKTSQAFDSAAAEYQKAGAKLETCIDTAAQIYGQVSDAVVALAPVVYETGKEIVTQSATLVYNACKEVYDEVALVINETVEEASTFVSAVGSVVTNLDTAAVTTWNNLKSSMSQAFEQQPDADYNSREGINEYKNNNDAALDKMGSIYHFDPSALKDFNASIEKAMLQALELREILGPGIDAWIKEHSEIDSIEKGMAAIGQAGATSATLLGEGFNTALEGMTDTFSQFGEHYKGMFDGFNESVGEGFSVMVETVGGSWEILKEGATKVFGELKNTVVSIVNGLKDAVIKAVVDMAKNWIMEQAALLLKEKGFAAIRIKIAAVIAEAQAIAASGWMVFGALAVGAAIFAAVMGLAGKFEHGGIVGGSSFTGDKVIARVNSGEMILNRSQQAQLFAMANGSALASSAAQSVNISQNISIAQNSGTLSEIINAVKQGTFEALEFANLTYKAGLKQNALVG